jgi:hypothetical protein
MRHATIAETMDIYTRAPADGDRDRRATGRKLVLESRGPGTAGSEFRGPGVDQASN